VATVTVIPSAIVIGPELSPLVPLPIVALLDIVFALTKIGGLVPGNEVPVPPPDALITVNAICYSSVVFMISQD
jgi:hypothetical protein